ncbi:MAG: hypothetical protein ACUVV3_04350 [Dehalococcoidia bacterium]
MPDEPVEVACYAGSRYPQRPLRVTWRGADHDVLAVEREWLEPARRCYLVRIEGDLLLWLCYHEHHDRWTAAEVGGSRGAARDDRK